MRKKAEAILLACKMINGDTKQIAKFHRLRKENINLIIEVLENNINYETIFNKKNVIKELKSLGWINSGYEKIIFLTDKEQQKITFIETILNKFPEQKFLMNLITIKAKIILSENIKFTASIDSEALRIERKTSKISKLVKFNKKELFYKTLKEDFKLDYNNYDLKQALLDFKKIFETKNILKLNIILKGE